MDFAKQQRYFFHLHLILLSLFVLFHTHAVYAAPETAEATAQPTTSPRDETTFRENLATAGLTYTITGSNLDINIDQNKTISALPRLQSLGYLNSNIPADAIRDKPTLITFTIGVIFTTAILHYNFEMNPKLDKIHVTSYIIPKDNSPKQACYSFDFNRDLYTKTNWNKLSYNEFIKLIPNFNFTNWCRGLMTKEMQQKETPAATKTKTTKP